MRFRGSPERWGMHLYLIRHAHAEDGKDDDARPLSAKGVKQIRRIGKALRAAGAFAAKEVWHSPLVRSRDTAVLLRDRLESPRETDRGGGPAARGRSATHGAQTRRFAPAGRRRRSRSAPERAGDAAGVWRGTAVAVRAEEVFGAAPRPRERRMERALAGFAGDGLSPAAMADVRTQRAAVHHAKGDGGHAFGRRSVERRLFHNETLVHTP